MTSLRYLITDDTKRFYRYEMNCFYKDTIKVTLEIYYAVKETPKGCWIADEYWDPEFNEGYGKKWVSNTAMKRFAYPTKEEAYVNFVARKNKSITIMTSRIKDAEAGLKAIERIKESGFTEDCSTETIYLRTVRLRRLNDDHLFL